MMGDLMIRQDLERENARLRAEAQQVPSQAEYLKTELVHHRTENVQLYREVARLRPERDRLRCVLAAARRALADVSGLDHAAPELAVAVRLCDGHEGGGS